MQNNTINGKTPEEIKLGLRCDETGDCTNTICPYFPEKDCLHSRHFDALTIINQLLEDNQRLECERDEARNDLDTINYANTELHSAYEAMKRERDAAVAQLKDVDTMDFFYCSHCKHEKLCDYNLNSCEDCENDCPCHSCIDMCNWQWRGVQEVT